MDDPIRALVFYGVALLLMAYLSLPRRWRWRWLDRAMRDLMR